MRVLVIGGYGFLGSTIAEKLIKENYKITVIDDLSSGHKSNLTLHHNAYTMASTSHRCQKIFKDEHFDVVIYCASQNLRTLDLTNEHSKSNNIVGLRHSLELSLTFKVKKFIFLSSYEVYGQGKTAFHEHSHLNPSTDMGRDFYYQESFCKDYVKKGLEVNVLRLAKVYGPKLLGDKSNLISMIYGYHKAGKSLNLTHGHDLSKDYVYVTDVADAVYKTLENPAPFIVNICSMSPLKNNTILEEAYGDENLSRDGLEEVAYEDIYDTTSFTMDNALAYKTLGWYPITDMKVGLERTKKWFDKADIRQIKEIEPPVLVDQAPKSLWQRVYPYLENVGIFLGFVFLSFVLRDLFKIDVDIMLVYIVIISVFYGLGQGTVSVLLATIFFFYLKLVAGSDIANLIFDLNNIFSIAVYVLVGIFSGYALDKERYEYKLIKRDLKDMENELNFVVGVYDKSIRIKNALQYDIENYEDSFGKVFDITDRLNKLHSEEIFNASVEVIAQIMKAKSVSIIYMDKHGYYGRIMAVKGQQKYSNSLKVEDTPFLDLVVHEKKSYINKLLKSNTPMVAAPIIFEEGVIAVVTIDDVEFENISLHYVNMLKVVTLLIANAIASAALYQDAVEAEKYVEGTQIMTQEWFDKIIEIKAKANDDNLSTSYLLDLDLSLEQGLIHHDTLIKLMRNFDYLGLSNQGHIRVLFSNARPEDKGVLRQRFMDQGFKIKEV